MYATWERLQLRSCSEQSMWTRGVWWTDKVLSTVKMYHPCLTSLYGCRPAHRMLEMGSGIAHTRVLRVTNTLMDDQHAL